MSPRNLPELNIFLFDVDGVLVDPLAYKEGLKKSTEVLCIQAGIQNWKELIPNDADVAFMESRGIHDVWDMTNIVFAQILSAAFKKYNSKISNALSKTPANLTDTQSLLHTLHALKIEIDRPDYHTFASKITSDNSQRHPPDAALDLLLASCSGRAVPCTASNAPAKSTAPEAILLRAFLEFTRNVYKSYGTRIFQNIILGSADFESNYKLKSTYDGASLLKTIDRVLLSASCLAKLNELQKQDNCKMAVYTARPSQVPGDLPAAEGYSPEAEIAAEAAGLSHLPLVGMGMMEWLASRHNERTEDLTKPNLTHSLSALLAAVLQSNGSSTLELAYSFERAKTSSELSPLANKHINIFVFEDTSSGIKPMQSLANELCQQSFSITVTALGIANHPDKAKSLEGICHRVFLNINDALEFVLKSI